MKLEDQVVSLDLAKKLKELGVRQESIFYWRILQYDKSISLVYGRMGSPGICEWVSAFTVAELGEMLPPFVTTEKYLCKQKPRFNTHEEETMECHSWHDDKEADARAKMLIHLIKEGIVKP